ncbi:TetR/AcrR family transcriptional regulator [Ramlibacter sp.]|uniref:TetR/AcrR family transcriptional regulator n=1 Tax=Ramlibacter sp. TaxID=1917967 RepID=UPI003D14D0D8
MDAGFSTLGARSLDTYVSSIRSLVDDRELLSANREKLADTAVRLFRERGFHHTSTRDIARAAGMSAGALYQYIEQKEDLLVLILQKIIRTYEARLFPLEAGASSARERMDRAIEVYYRMLDENSESIDLFFHEYANLGRLTKRYIAENDARVFEALRHIVEQRVAEDGLDGVDTRFVTHNIMSMGQMWSLKRGLFREVMTLDGYIAQQKAHLEKVLRP